ncbi:MAG TPA: right-handed parallel beta-helix repeat-containing protein [Humisphaera sp.]|jgi:hypothetical protein|nr:right-handed parallel beta-helix repeat-containing protein [Humisphaera sp.]
MRILSNIVLVLSVALLLVPSSFASTFYIDSASGNDANDGSSPQHALKSLDAVNAKTFGPGDRLLFKAGSKFSGQLKPQGSGKLIDEKPQVITIDMYGQGLKPRIDGEGQALDALLLRNVEYWDVANLEITNHGEQRAAGRTGVRVVSDGAGIMHGIHLHDLFVHDVNGELTKQREGCGIFFESRGANPSSFDGLLIDNCHVVQTDRNGICQRTAGRAHSTHVVIRNNLLEDIGGDGIKIWGSNGALVEHNIIRGGRMRAQDAAAGIWPFDSDDTVIQFNDVGGMKGTNDGQGFDSDYRCHRTLIQYNYSHDNDGGFILICAPGTSFCEGTIVRYNISQHDGIKAARVFHISGNVTNTSIYNNTIYVAEDQDLPLLLFTDWSRGNPDTTRFYNNIFYADGKARFTWGKSTNNVFENNVFFGNLVSPPDDPARITEKPPLMRPGKGTDLASLDAYRPTVEGKMPRGKIVADNGGRDFFGMPLPKDQPPCVGAAEGTVARAARP